MNAIFAIFRLLRASDYLLLFLATASFSTVYYLKDATLQSYALNLSASLVFASVIRMADFYRSVMRDVTLVNFFGPSITKNDLIIVYPEFELEPKISKLDAVKKAVPDSQKLFIKPFSPDEVTRVDVPRCAATNDLQAVIEVSSIFSEAAGKTPPLSSDIDWQRLKEHSFVTVGFTSNLLSLCWLSVNESQIKRIHGDENEKFSEHILVCPEAGEDGHVEFASTEAHEIGIVAKCTPDKDRPEIVWFLVAGLGPNATVGAAIFLARKWRKIHQKLGQSNFLIVLQTKPDIPEYSEPVYTLKDGKKADIKW